MTVRSAAITPIPGKVIDVDSHKIDPVDVVDVYSDELATVKIEHGFSDEDHPTIYFDDTVAEGAQVVLIGTAIDADKHGHGHVICVCRDAWTETVTVVYA
jgi:hypothetical protein